MTDRDKAAAVQHQHQSFEERDACSECGPLVAAAWERRRAGERHDAAPLYCGHCRDLLVPRDTSLYCRNCRVVVAETEPEPKPTG
jgi:hypothetical protein